MTTDKLQAIDAVILNPEIGDKYFLEEWSLPPFLNGGLVQFGVGGETNPVRLGDGPTRSALSSKASNAEREGGRSYFFPSEFNGFDSTTNEATSVSPWFVLGRDGEFSQTLQDVVGIDELLEAFETEIDLAEYYGSNDADTIDRRGTLVAEDIRGLGGNDRIYDGQGDDVVFGEAGNDQFYGNLGADHYDGGEGNDLVRYNLATAGLTIDLVNVANNTGIAAGDTYASIERVQGSNHDDVIRLSAGASLNNARNGNDDVTDGMGYETMRGGNGLDVFRLVADDGAEDRILDFEVGADKIDLSAWGVTGFDQLSIDAITLEDVRVSFGSESLILAGVLSQNDALTAFDFGLGDAPSGTLGVIDGGAIAETINGDYFDVDGDTVNDAGQTIEAGSGNDRIYDGQGDDVVFGEAGNDQFYGNLGADHYDGGEGNDLVRYNLATAGLTIDLVNVANNTGIAAGDTYTSIERVQGSNHDDVFVLSPGVTLQDAKNGNDVITDGAGLEKMKGGLGADTFVFVSGDNSRDSIEDFTIGEDIIDLSRWGVANMGELTISEGSASTGGIWIDFGSEGLQLENLNSGDLGLLEADSFLFSDSLNLL